MKISFRDFLQKKIKAGEPVFFDGGMGTMIQKTGISGYSIPEELNFTHPEIITDIHTEYLKAGSSVLTANSFGANPVKLSSGGETSYTAEEIISRAIQLQKNALEAFEATDLPHSKEPHFVSWDSGQIGKLLEPMGPLTFDEAYESYRTCAIAAEKAGADLAIIETMSDLYEVKACILAIKENTSLPIVATMTFQQNLRTLTGADVLTCVTYLEALRPDVIGFNCGGTLKEDEELTRQFVKYATLPVLVQPNAGLPVVENGRTVFKVQPDVFAESQKQNRLAGASLLGGCCGTTPGHIRATVELTESLMPDDSLVQKDLIPGTYISSYNLTVKTGTDAGPKIIGERINPTGKKKCKEALLSGNMQFVLDEAESQINAGAHILDVNTGLPGIDEAETMRNAVKTIQEAFNTPLQLDSSDEKVLEKNLRYYNGKALVNSVNGKQEVMEKVFPLIKHYGGAVVALCIDEEGIAPTAEGRVKVAEKMIAKAAEYGIKPRDIFIDTLTLTVSSEQKTAMETIRAIRMLKEKYGNQGLQFVLGVSNISFGLPRRDIINSRFLMLALEAGLSAPILNPGAQGMMDTFRSYRILNCFDENCLEYIETYTDTLDPSGPKFRQSIIDEAIEKGILTQGTGEAKILTPKAENESSGNEISDSTPEEKNLIKIIEKGFKDKAKDATRTLLKTHDSIQIVNRCIVPALDNVGAEFEKGKKFLPQLLLSADTVSESFSEIKAQLSQSGQKQESKGTVCLATVQGDIHDIGKNIVKAMLENYGFTVIDLGKNVPVQTVVDTVIEKEIKLLGLSALMTTTVASMEETIKQLRIALKAKGAECKVIAGGAVLTPEYAEKIGADYYSKDAMETVRIAQSEFNCLS